MSYYFKITKVKLNPSVHSDRLYLLILSGLWHLLQYTLANYSNLTFKLALSNQKVSFWAFQFKALHRLILVWSSISFFNGGQLNTHWWAYTCNAVKRNLSDSFYTELSVIHAYGIPWHSKIIFRVWHWSNFHAIVPHLWWTVNILLLSHQQGLWSIPVDQLIWVQFSENNLYTKWILNLHP